ncbi:serine/threonine-protein kinase ATR-like isoform X2 [Styela clava]
MAAIGEILSSIVADYENISSLPPEQLVTKCVKIRESLKMIIHHHLTDVNSIFKELEKAKGKTSQTEMVLNFLHHLIGQFPHPVFAPSSAQFHMFSENERKMNFSNYKDFVFWFCNSLLRLLSTSGLKKIHNDINKMLIALFELIKTKNIPMFRLIITEVIQLSAELDQIYEENLNQEDNFENLQQSLKSFRINNSDENACLTINSFDFLCTLRKNCSGLIHPFISDICQFAEDQLDVVWCISLFQLEHGDFMLKSSSLQLLTSLLQHSGIPKNQILQYFVFCFVASFELGVSLLKEDDISLKSEEDWKSFLNSFSQFMDELFSLQGFTVDSSSFKTGEREKNIHTTSECVNKMTVNYYIPQTYILTICEVLIGEMQTLKSTKIDDTDVAKKFVASIISCLRHIVVSTRRDLDASPSLIAMSRMRDINRLCTLVLDNDQFRDSSMLISESIVCELSYYLVNKIDGDVNTSSEFLILDSVVTIFTQKQQRITNLCKDNSNDVTKLILPMDDYCSYLNVFVSVMLSVKPDEDSTDVLFISWMNSFLNKILQRNEVSMLVKVFLDCMNASFIKSTSTSSKPLIEFYRLSLKIIQYYCLLLHSATMNCSDIERSSIEVFSKALALPFTTLSSLPWIDSLKLEDLNSDLVDTGLLHSTLIPVSQGLKKAGINISNTADLDAESKDVICECLKVLAIAFEPKYQRWCSSILFRWSIGKCTEISNTSLSMLPFFIQNSLRGTGALKGILSHVKTASKELETKFSHTDLLVLSSLLYNIIKLSQGNCRILVENEQDGKNLCSSCYRYQTKLCSYFFELVQYSEEVNMSNVLDLVGSIVTSLQNCLLHHSVNDMPEDHQQCYSVLQNMYLKAAGEYFASLQQQSVTQDMKGILTQWIYDLKFYNDADMNSMFGKIIGKDNLSWTRTIMAIIVELLRNSHRKKDVKTRLHGFKLIGVILKLSMKDSSLELTCSDIFTWSVTQLCTQLSSSLLVVQSNAYLELSNISSSNCIQKYSLEICTCIAKSLVDNDPCTGKRAVVEILEDFANIFSSSADEFLRHHMSAILPVVILSDKCEKLLKTFSEITGTSKADILMQNFKHIVCHAVVTGNNLQNLFEFLEKETRIKKESLLLLNFGGLLHHLVSHISVNVDGVHSALTVISDVKNSSSKKASKSASGLSELLQPHFLGILTFFNCQLRSSSVAGTEKKRIIESLTCLLKLMDVREVTSVRVKIINTLCLAQQLFKHLNWYTICCEAWNTFVRCIEPSCLGSLLSQITVTLLPLLKTLPNQVSTILSYLVIDKSSNTKDNLHELYFLPKHSALENVYRKVQEEISRRHQDDIVTYLEQAIQLMSHESAEVRIQALARLKQTLKEKQKEIQQHHLSSGRDVTDVTMSHLVSTLLFGCRDNNKQIRLLCGQCLGLIGAIDPDRLVLSLPGTSTGLSDYFTIDDPNFAFHLISELVKAFLAAKPTHQDISAFAIQELLKIYDCKDGLKDTHGRRLWRKFSENIQEVLEPHHTSRYLLKKSEIPLSNLKQPVLFRKPNMTFRDWAGSFCAVLMQMVYESSDITTASKVFRSCSAVTRNDVNVALFLLPHTTLQCLLLTDHADFIIQEILAILEHTEQLMDRVGVEFEIESSNMRTGSGLDQISSQENSANLLNAQHARGSHLLQLSAQAIFSALDHITRWLRQAEIGATDSKTKASSSSRSGQNAVNISSVKTFLSKIPQLSLAEASFRCRVYRRALLHYEAHLRGNRDSSSHGAGYTVDEQGIDFLQQLFVEMDEPDGVAGIAAVRLGKPTLNIQIKQLESTGKLQDACTCYEHAIQLNPEDIRRRKDYVKCLMDLGQLSIATCVIDGTLSKQGSWKNELNSFRIEAAWRLGRWDALEEYLDLPSESKNDLLSRSHDWNTRLGELLLVIKDNKWNKFQNLVDEIYLDQTGPLSAASMESGSYQRGYKSILRLHMLTELESIASEINTEESININSVSNECFNSWQERIRPLQTSFKPREPVLALQRTMLELLNLTAARQNKKQSQSEIKMKKLVGKLWLESAKQARKAGYLQTAYNALINAQDLDLPEFCIEHAKWLWNKGESHQALLTLQKGVADHFPDGNENPNLSRDERMSKAKAMLLVARLMEESSSFDSNTVLKQFREVVAYMNEWEDSHFHAAKYYDKLMTAFMGDNRASGKANHLYYIMHHYGLSLCYGTSHIYESLTKLLTVWLDYEANVAKLQKANKPYSKDDAQKLINVIADLRSRLPAYIFLTAFSQLVSRICHQHLPTFEELKQVVAKVICAYPQQALWTMMAISKSSFPQRAQRCKEIFDVAEARDRKLGKLLSDATRLTEKLLELCNKPTSAIQSLSISTHFKPLKKLVEESSFSEILLPLQRFMTVTLPQGDTVGTSVQEQSTSGRSSSNAPTRSHDPFPEHAVHIVGFEDIIEVLPSLQRPKKVSIRASDGRSYLFLCKPKDDLRKDARLMEFNTIVNKCLKLDSETRKRQLKIRTYAVIPLNEECGLIEWVPHTRGFRHILIARYKQMGTHCTNRELVTYIVQKTAPLQKKLDVFKNKLLPRHPAVFGDWFLTTFPDPTSWYSARLAYARSTAVMSMVGYILGLGDRHGENILFDSITGDAVHVDFNCLFNKGMSLDVPEIVPFRLTHNMTDAMGPMRHEGFFRCACETVMRLLRQQREPLLSVLKTFIYDPLVEWSKRSRSGVTNESGEILNEKALSHVSDIDKRLRGIAAKNKGLPLSVEGHVHYLIQEATDEEKLCQMYIGWAPYM